ncbi:hypothetical protein [uncultured Methanolobus sp.]|uniref:hypothetical protein n=1 Tax=uncultured Methanolobus sp. TaxID=218300 RepID=UPI0029C78F57|nr:hypothetical protein [uncultured Methanolobus sp.]
MYTVYITTLNGSYINVDKIIQLYVTEYEGEEYIMAMSSYETADPILEYKSNKNEVISGVISIIAGAKIQSETIGDAVIIDLADQL